MYNNVHLRERVAFGGGCLIRYYSNSRKHALMFIYYPLIDIEQIFILCELSKYYSKKHDKLEPTKNSNIIFILVSQSI